MKTLRSGRALPLYFLNGSPSRRPVGLSHLNCARGVFETFAIRPGGVIAGFNFHMERLERGALEFGCRAPERGEIAAVLDSALDEAGHNDSARGRIVSLPESWYFELEDLPPQPDSVSLFPVCAERPFPHYKSCCASASIEASARAKAAGFEEALLLAPDFTVKEGAWSNFFWFDDKEVLRSAASGVLPGVTRLIALKLADGRFETMLADFTLETVIERCAEAFITKSTAGIVPVNSIGELRLPVRSRGPTARLSALYIEWINGHHNFSYRQA